MPVFIGMAHGGAAVVSGRFPRLCQFSGLDFVDVRIEEPVRNLFSPVL